MSERCSGRTKVARFCRGCLCIYHSTCLRPLCVFEEELKSEERQIYTRLNALAADGRALANKVDALAAKIDSHSDS